MMNYKKICTNCLIEANRVVGLWEGIYEHSINYGDPIESPYDVITLDDIDGGCKSINDICHEIEHYDMLCCDYMYTATNQLIRAFCEIIGEPFDEKYLAYDEQTFWRINPISGKYAFTLLEMWWVVSEYGHWVERCGSIGFVEEAVKEWYEYHKNGGKTNLWHWLMGAME